MSWTRRPAATGASTCSSRTGGSPASDADLPRRRRARRHRAGGVGRLPGPDRHARPLARAGSGAQGDNRDRHGVGGRRRLHGGRLHAQHRSGQRLGVGHAAHPGQAPPRPALARVYPIGAVSVGSRGEQLTEIGDLRAAGCVAISDDGRPVATALLMRRALEYASMFEHAGHRARRGPIAQGRRRRARGRRGGPARVARHSRCRRVDHGRARRQRGRADRRARAHRAHERPAVAARRARRQGRAASP